MKLAIVVHGRFHAFELARALLAREHDVTVFTNYPARVVDRRFGIPAARVRGFALHGALIRLSTALERFGVSISDAWLHRSFARWAAARLRTQRWDAAICWSGVAEEPFLAVEGSGALRMLVRGSTHIATQARLLEEEERRAGSALDRPSAWIIARELREYELADRIRVISTFAHHTFRENGVAADKLCLIPSAVPLEHFRPASEVVAARRARIRGVEPLRVLYVGALSFRKGFLDLVEIARRIQGSQLRLSAVGPVAPEVRALLPDLERLASVRPAVAQAALPAIYAENDIFIFPSIEEGYPQVVAQARASALPVLATVNAAGEDLVADNVSGWILPVRSPERFVERLLWCDRNREALAAMVDAAYSGIRHRTWAEVAAEVEDAISAFGSRAAPRAASRLAVS